MASSHHRIKSKLSPKPPLYRRLIPEVKTGVEVGIPAEIIFKKGDTEIIKPLSQLCTEQNFEWSEAIVIDENSTLGRLVVEAQSLPLTSEASNPEVKIPSDLKAHLDNPHADLKKFKLLDMDKLGLAVIADMEIKEKSVLSFYAGELTYDVNGSAHSLQSRITIPMRDCLSSNIFSSSFKCVINAARIGNISRFFPHLPTGPLSDCDFPGVNTADIATANIEWCTHNEKGLMVQFFRADQPIHPDELVGFDYGPGYWRDRQFWLFNKKGEPLAEVKYEINPDTPYSPKIVLASKSLTPATEEKSSPPAPEPRHAADCPESSRRLSV